MKILFCIVGFLIFSALGESKPTFAEREFVRNYRAAYAAKSDVYTDTSLVYIPALVNLERNINSWGKLSISQRRQLLLRFINEPIIANDMAVNVNKDEWYTFPMGTLYYKGKYEEHIVGPMNNVAWFYKLVQSPLVEYLRNTSVEFVFTIDALLPEDKIQGLFWTIQDGCVYVLLYDKGQGVLYPVEARTFLTDIAKDEYFKLFFEL